MKQKPVITVYRPNQIGGCITEIESNKGTKIIIDVGSNLPGIEVTEEVDVNELTKNSKGVFITHYHGDHVGEFEEVDDDVPIYMGKIAHELFLNLCSFAKKDSVETVKNFKTFQARDAIIIDDITVTPYRVDHSAYDSNMFLIECDNKRILHTGDFRMHGWSGKNVEAMLNYYFKGTKIHALICEGTMLSGRSKKKLTEEGLYKIAKKLMSKKANKNIFILCSSMNIDSIASFYKAATESRKRVYADRYQRSNLDIVSANAACDLYCFPFVTVYFSEREDCKEKMKNDGFCMFVRYNGDMFEEILKEYPDNLFIYSLWDGYLTEEFRDNKIYNYVPKDENDTPKVFKLHTSGHAYEEDIIKLCEIVNPEVIFPIHGENPGRFEILKEENLQKIKGKVKRLTSRKPVEI